MAGLGPARYRIRPAASAADLGASLDLRARVFRGDGREDGDRFDPRCRHMLIERADDGALMASFRFMLLADGDEIDRCYAAQFYDLAGLRAWRQPLMELGRFCIAPDCRDPDLFRLAFAKLGQLVAQERVAMLFGCSSFPGTLAAPYGPAFALLARRYRAPAQWRPRPKAPAIVPFDPPAAAAPDLKAALKGMPPLLRAYLALGARVSDHAVVDRDLETLHVFTGLEVSSVPAARARRLRQIPA